jgi:hypothetical protein
MTSKQRFNQLIIFTILGSVTILAFVSSPGILALLPKLLLAYFFWRAPFMIPEWITRRELQKAQVQAALRRADDTPASIDWQQLQ